MLTINKEDITIHKGRISSAHPLSCSSVEKNRLGAHLEEFWLGVGPYERQKKYDYSDEVFD